MNARISGVLDTQTDTGPTIANTHASIALDKVCKKILMIGQLINYCIAHFQTLACIDRFLVC